MGDKLTLKGKIRYLDESYIVISNSSYMNIVKIEDVKRIAIHSGQMSKIDWKEPLDKSIIKRTATIIMKETEAV